MYQLSSRHSTCLLMWAGLAILLAGPAFGHVKQPVPPPEPNIPVLETPPVDSIGIPVVDWPTWYGVQQTGQVNGSFTSWGTFGHGVDRVRTTYDSWPTTSFEAQAGTNTEYLFAGGVWVGGIVGADTLVSLGMDGWQYVTELYPPAGPDGKTAASVMSFPYSTSFSMRAEFTDTINADQIYGRDVIANRPHIPLNISIANRSHVWRDPVFNNAVVYDMVITNIGDQTIHSGYVGFYFDCDVGQIGSPDGAQDDITGFLSADSVAYIADNDGGFGDLYQVPSAFAFKVLSTSFPLQSTSYNWWVSNGDPTADFGPMRKDRYRNFGTGGVGTPEGDANKYYIMSNGEWDYDQVMTASITPDDSVWLYPQLPLVQPLARGFDTRFLYSVGPFELPPDSSIRIVYATFAGGVVHQDPDNYRNNLQIAYRPADYIAGLHFEQMREYAKAADSVAKSFLHDPAAPPIGLRVRSLNSDSLLLTWDPWAYPGVEGYVLEYTEIPKSAYVHEGVPPVWWYSGSPSHTVELGKVTSKVLAGLNPYKTYSCRLRHRIGAAVGSASPPVVRRIPTPVPVPELTDTLAFCQAGNPVTFTWRGAGGMPVDHYTIYKFSDTAEARLKFPKHYSEYRGANPVDSVNAGKWYYYYALPEYAIVPGNETTFVETAPGDGNVYVVTATDTAGFETNFSSQFTVYAVGARTKDVLVMTSSTSWLINYVYPDSIRAFYDRVLGSRSHDYYMYMDSMAICSTQNALCVHWKDFMPYKVVIVDDGLRDRILTSSYEDAEAGFAKYVLSGGILVYCGSFSQFTAISLGPTTMPAWYGRQHPFVHEFFGIDSVYYVGVGFYKNNTVAPYIDSLLGFQTAEPAGALPALTYDTANHRYSSYVSSNWPSSSPPSVSVFRHDTTTTVTHVFRSLYPSQSRAEGLPVGLHKKTAKANAWVFGFHLWYMNEFDAASLINEIIASAPVITDVGQTQATLPVSAVLSQNWPNPFNPSTTIRYSLPTASEVRLEIFNILGQRVRTLSEGLQPSGEHAVVWDGNDSNGSQVASGIYLYRLSVGSLTLNRKMLLLK